MTWQKYSLSRVIEQIPIGVAVTLPDGTIEYANPCLRRLLGLGAAQMPRVDLAEFRAAGAVPPREEIRQALLAGLSWQAETQFRTQKGETRQVLESVYSLYDEAGTITHFIHFMQDISALKRTEMLSGLAFYDNLTGLPNRNLFDDRLARAMATAQRRRSGFALLYIDIDRFKRVNDTLGHDAGDELLRQLASRLKQSLRESDTVARLGGDEFVAILEHVADARVAARVVEKLLADCSGCYELRGSERKVTLSVGVSLYPGDADDAESLLKCADTAMYRAKAAGRNGYQLREPHCADQYWFAACAAITYRLFYTTVMSPLTLKTLSLLADGEFRSGQDLAATLGVSRGAIWYALRGVDDFGIEIHKVRGRGYRLAQPLSLLDRTEVLRELGAHASRFALEIFDSTESTNTLLMHRASCGAAGGSVIATEWQTHGRGRRGSIWHSMLGSALTFSLLWRFQQGVGFLAGLSLAVGLAVARSLAALGVHDSGLKWPNDVMWRGRKLAGILIEMQGDMLGPSAAVIGIGLNCRVPDVLRARIDQPVVDLEEAGGAAPDRNHVLAVLLVELERTLLAFARDGFAPLREEWERCHVYQRKAVKILLPDGSKVSGTAEGVADDGTFLITTNTGQRRFHSGDVSVRANNEQ